MYCDRLVDDSVRSLGNAIYDRFQAVQNGINYG